MLATAATNQLAEPRPVYANHGYRYWRQRLDGRVLMGGYRDTAVADEVGFDDAPTHAVQAHLDRHLQELSPGARVTHRWAGTMGFSPDELPLVGQVPGAPGLSVCAGYTGHGMGFAAACAERLVQAVFGNESELSWLAPERFLPRLRS
jgi:glycine/D-amino acid oxidase-like deaminating enzyme